MSAGFRDSTSDAARVLVEVESERTRQDVRWGQQNHPDGTGARVAIAGRLAYAEDLARDARLHCQTAARRDAVTWRHIIREELYEALAESDPAKLRTELLQVAAVCVAWIEAIDRRMR